MPNDSRRGQSLIELLVGITIGVLFITAALGLIAVSLRIDFQNKFSQTAGELNQELIEQITAVAGSNWHNIGDLTEGLAYSITPDGAGWFTTPPSLGTATITPTVGDNSYEVSFATEKVYRTSIDDDTLATSLSGVLDPSTLKITATTHWVQSGEPADLILTKYLTRTQNRIWRQTDWSGSVETGAVYVPGDYPVGPDSSHVAIEVNILRGSTAPDPPDATPGQLSISDLTANRRSVPGLGIDPNAPNHYAWNDVIGWIDFAFPSAYPVLVGSTISGVVGSRVGEIALDCARTPVGNTCGNPPTYSVNQDANGILDGYAWNSAIGWISFNCSNNNSCLDNSTCPVGKSPCAGPGGFNYNVSLGGGATPVFSGWAWNDIVGWISFNCANLGTNGCSAPGVNYLVATKNSVPGVSVGEVTSATFDTQRVGGAAFNTIRWDGVASGGTVQFKIATSNCSNGADNFPLCNSGTWNYVGPDSGNSESYYEPSGPGVATRINRADHSNKRYLRYVVYLLSDAALSQSPVVNDVIINWSL